MFTLRDQDGKIRCTAEVEEDLWVGSLPLVPWADMDVDKMIDWTRASHLSRGWTVEETKEDGE